MSNEDFEIIIHAMDREFECDPQLKHFVTDPLEIQELAELRALSASIADPEASTFTVS